MLFIFIYDTYLSYFFTVFFLGILYLPMGSGDFLFGQNGMMQISIQKNGILEKLEKKNLEKVTFQ